MPANSQIVFDDDGRLHFAVLEPEPESASLCQLREAVEAMLPRVEPAGGAAGGVLVDRRRPGVHLGHRGEARLKDLHVMIAALWSRTAATSATPRSSAPRTR